MINPNTNHLVFSTENLSIKFKVTSRSKFKNGFTIHMLVGNKNVGNFKYYLDPAIGPSHDIEVLPEYRNKGYGKLLLLKTIQVANDHKIGFESDAKITKDQERVYNSLIRDNLIDGYLGSWKLTKKGEDTLEQAESESSVTSNFLHEKFLNKNKKSFIEKVKKKLNYNKKNKISKFSKKVKDYFHNSQFSDGKNYWNVEDIYAIAKKLGKPKIINISDLQNNRKWWDGNIERMINSDTSYPILVILENDGSMSVADGLNRLEKAITVEKSDNILAYVVNKEDIMNLTVSQN